jgi:Holliday junction resolvase RusA-like endonuclease
MEKYAIFNLEEAKKHLDKIIEELRKSKNLELLTDGSLSAYFQELYWHINKVWNGRKMEQKDIDNTHDEEFDELCDFPKDLDL